MSSQSQTMIISATEFKPSNDIKYSKPKVNASGGKAVNIVNAKDGQVLNLSTPLVLTWGVQEFVDEKTGKKTYDMALQFPKEDYATPATTNFLNAMKNLEDKLKADAVANSKDWFNKQKMEAVVVDALWTPMLRYPKDPHTGEPDLNRAPTMKVKLNYWDNEFTNTEIYDMDQKLLFGPDKNDGKGPIELVSKATNVAVVMRCGGLWFANGKFGVTWRLVQAVVKPRPTLAGKCHISLNADERSKLASQEDDDDETIGSETKVANTNVVDSEDEDEDISVAVVEETKPVEPVPEPEKKAVKRKVVRKKAAAAP